MIHLIPAYGRDYKTKAQVQADLDSGKDFIVSSYVGDPSDGRLTNNQDFGGQSVMVRFKRMTVQYSFKVKATQAQPVAS